MSAFNFRSAITIIGGDYGRGDSEFAGVRGVGEPSATYPLIENLKTSAFQG